MSALVKFDAVTELAKHYGMAAEAFLHTMRAVAMPKPHSDEELMSCLLVAREHALNPLTKEIYFMRSKAGIQPVVSVDGWAKKCNEHPQFDGMEFETIRDDNGNVRAMRCRIYRLDRSRPVEVEEDLKECAAGGGPVWKSHPNRMLRNRALCQAARLAFGMAGVMEPDEFQQWDAVPLDISADVIDIPVAFQGKDPRDGGPLVLKGEPVKRGASGAFKETGGADKFNVLSAQIAACTSIDDLLNCYDAFERGGMPWADFPSGWARLLHADYALRLEELSHEPEIASIDLLERAIIQAKTRDELAEIFREQFDGVPWGAVEEQHREDIAELYQVQMEGKEAA